MLILTQLLFAADVSLSELDESVSVASVLSSSDWELCGESDYDARSAYTVIDGASEENGHERPSASSSDLPAATSTAPSEDSFSASPAGDVVDSLVDEHGGLAAASISTPPPPTLPRAWSCLVCLQIPADPVATICGHIFCQRYVARHSLSGASERFTTTAASWRSWRGISAALYARRSCL